MSAATTIEAEGTMKSRTFSIVIAVLLTCPAMLVSTTAQAEVSRVEITSRTDVEGGKSFGEVGAYERLVGKIYFSLDPTNPRNKVIIDIDNAPKNATGQVEFSSDIVVLRPKDPTRGNQVAFFDILNRGRMRLPTVFNLGPGQGEFGEALLMTRGYTLVAVGWEFNPRGSTAALYPPVATENGKPIVGSISAWFVPSAPDKSFDLFAGFWTGLKDYPPLDPLAPDYKLTERYGFFSTDVRVIPREQWKFGRSYEGSFVVDTQFVTLETGFKAGYTYELTYQAKELRVSGTAYAAIRDAASYFKYNPVSEIKAEYTYAYGSSQAGRFLRALMWEGFTIDERERQALDAIWVQGGGASLGSFNRRFVQPNEGGFYTTTWFPFLYEPTRDPVTGKRDGLSARIPVGKHPKVLMVDSSNEYWDRGRVAALNHVSYEGTKDVEPPANVRIYHVAGTRHGFSGVFPPRPNPAAQLPATIVDGKPVQRALMVALDNWVRKGQAPPPSRYPKLSEGTLVAQENIKFPDVPGIRFPYNVPGGYRSDLPGPLTKNPVAFLVPQVDADGNEKAGILMPDVAVPLATNTGWAFRSEETGAPDLIAFLTGSYLPFAATKAERTKRGDPRLSVEERYTNRAEYVQKVNEATQRLVADRYLLPEDAEVVAKRAIEHWEIVTGEKPMLTQRPSRPASPTEEEVLPIGR